MKYLKGKTRVLVTHQLQFLPFADKVKLTKQNKTKPKQNQNNTNTKPTHNQTNPQIVVMKQGKIQRIGTYAELMASDIELTQAVQLHTEKVQRVMLAKKGKIRTNMNELKQT